ncbi:phosphoenolpyruvate--protein phosphotransferase [Thiococcus pfennigii]|jgi:phosphotransferase system enzyme I (PtsI)|uniref:phosphoenolpyruvate--protein phosphotransferase n=1 Tax=Thiococcus pfennigii TaxID=1057 RepID=UPI0019063E34|nr:phosphoenolpyruvate--protein phosphotransferase [Thiococcus pfennigii]MBK1701583.1 phosphoenolpyruvate--protein phosphotransferase [Thiococcus pfennigii]MBK1731569.1 phosphoenolpyruvate--protein phosphotransferase [Thiococcus pfennigii]
MTLALVGQGVATSLAIAIGKALVIERGQASIVCRSIAPEAIDAELERLAAAVDAASDSLREIRRQIPGAVANEIEELIDAHLLMLEDVTLVETSRQLIRERLYSAEWALQVQRDRLIETFERMDDPYLRARGEDVDQVVLRIQGFLCGRPNRLPQALATDMQGRIVVARDFTPADVIALHYRGAAAYVSEYGGPMSHMAILARSLNIPAVMGVHRATAHLLTDEILVVDGETGTVIAEADAATIAHYRRRLRALGRRRNRLRQLIDKPAVTADGTEIELLANLELPEDVVAARTYGARGIGLYRTEFLYMNRADLPDEDEHFATYSEIVRGLDGIPITIRTIDLGTDKHVSAASALEPGCNPALGLRAIRLCLKEPSLFRPQLRAILRTAALGPVRLMLPMITSLNEVETICELIADIKEELRAEGLAFDAAMPVGGMIEVPAAALTASRLAQRLDFLSIGTNDLIQYTLAIDRVDDAVGYLYDPAHPAVLRLIRETIEAGRRQRRPVSMCGEMAGDPRFTRLLLGMGLRALSMQPGSLLEIKEIVRGSDLASLARQVEDLFAHLDDVDPNRFIDALNA